MAENKETISTLSEDEKVSRDEMAEIEEERYAENAAENEEAK